MNSWKQNLWSTLFLFAFGISVLGLLTLQDAPRERPDGAARAVAVR